MRHMEEHTLESFVMENLEIPNQEILSALTESYRSGKCTARKFSENIANFIHSLSEFEKKAVYGNIVKMIALPYIKMSNHFFARMIERYSALDFRFLCERIRQCTESALKNKRRRAKRNDLVVVVSPDQVLITLYTSPI